MPKYRYLALAAACAVVLAPGGVAFAASAHQAAKHDVLTIKKVNGTAVKKGAKLTAGLAKGAKLTVSFGSLGGATCTTSSIKAVVKSNTTSKATLSLTSQAVTKCKLTGAISSEASIKSVTAVGLPADVTVKAAKGGGTVTVAESSKSKPFGLAASVSVGSTSLTCAFVAKSITAKAVNKSNSIEVAGVTLTSSSKNSSTCTSTLPSVKVTVTYGPLIDSSAKGAKVFVS
jgi:hypothetical protein